MTIKDQNQSEELDGLASIKKSIKHRLKLTISYIGWEDILGFAILFIGVLGFFDYPIFGLQLPYITGWTDFYKSLWPELIGIGIAVLIIDNANETIKRREEKKRLILQMGSPDNAFAREAVLDAFLFHTVAEVQAITEDWLEEYNAIRPHEALGNVPPYHYVPKQP